MFALKYVYRRCAVRPGVLVFCRNYASKISDTSLSPKTSGGNKIVTNDAVTNSRTRAVPGNEIENISRPTLDAKKADYSYFERLASNAQAGRLMVSGAEVDRLTSAIAKKELHKADAEIISDDSSDKNIAKDAAKVKYFKLKPSIPKKSFNLAAYVNESETLSNLLKLGVDLSKIDKNIEDADFLVKLNFETGVQPYLAFLHKMGVLDADVGECITRNPGIFRESMDDLSVRVNYLEMKKFPCEAIARIITKSPTILSRTVKQIDEQLGFLQNLFLLTGDEVRLVVTKHPKIAVWNQSAIVEMKMTFKDFLGFTDTQVKSMLLHSPKLFLSGRKAIATRFDYLHNSIGFTHEDIIVWPQVLRTRVFIIRQRHEFLKSIGRNQFDPTKENYVSLKSLALGRDSEFCENVAKVPVTQFNEFLKMQ